MRGCVHPEPKSFCLIHAVDTRDPSFLVSVVQWQLLWPDYTRIRIGGEKTKLRLIGQSVYTCENEEPGMGREGTCLIPGARAWLSHRTPKFQNLMIIQIICQDKRTERVLFDSLLS